MLHAGLDGHRSAADLAVHNELRGFITIQLAPEVLLAVRAGDGDERIHVATSMGLDQNATWTCASRYCRSYRHGAAQPHTLHRWCGGEGHLRGHLHAVLLTQMPVGLGHQNPTVRMP